MAKRAELDDRGPVGNDTADPDGAAVRSSGPSRVRSGGTPDMEKVVAAVDATGDEPDLDAALELDAAIKLASERPAEWRRVRKWDRPREPRDWRYFVGTAGRIMLTTGILMFGFVAYQLWGTGIETARAQNALEDQFEAVLAARAATEQVDDAAATEPQAADDPDAGAGTEPDAEPAADGSAAPEPAAGSDPSDADPVGDDDVEDAPVAAADPVVPRDLADDAVEQDLPDFRRGDVLARLEIPRIDQDVFVVPGVQIDDLKDGPGHYPDTPLPGQLGNAAIAGHRTTYGSPFFDVDQLEPGDELIVTMVTGDRFVYRVTGTEIVEATDYWVVGTTDPNTAELTLTSCHPKYSARQRIVVRSVLDPERSAPVGIPTAYDLDAGNDAPIPGDDPVIGAGDPEIADEQPTEPTGSTGSVPRAASDVDEAAEPDPAADVADADPATPPGADRADPDDAVGDDAGAPAADPTPVPDEVAGGAARDAAGIAAGDEFARGWFDDSAAWSQIILWGLGLTLIALLARRISRRFRRDLVGAAVGIVPFVVALYFFFQNVHRLLPPGI